uniref:Uncharacterized protein n=1 Tax=Anguilla anguilla TaxID=7936 RepID=A0A0E9TK49_ANGAN
MLVISSSHMTFCFNSYSLYDNTFLHFLTQC